MNAFALIFGGLVILTQSWVEEFRKEDFSNFLKEGAEKYSLPKVETYDFIIVGGGLAGSVLANALSESYTVLVLEIGGDAPPMVQVPAYMPYINHLDEIAFVHKSSPHEFAAIENGGIINVPTGKVIGGGSTINGLVYNRGSPYDYDLWANMTRDDSWSYANLLPIFRGVEKYEGEFPSEDQHGTNGPLTISKQDYAPGLSAWLDSGKELGYDKKDPNGPQMVSFCPIEFNSKFGRRESVYDVYLKPILTRPNLTVRRYAEAKEIILDNANVRAMGVLYSRHSKQDQYAYARKEVIVAAGVFGSPKLLLRSGIGPSAHLIEANDHGPLTYAGQGAIGLGFIASARAIAEGYPGWPDIQLALQSYYDRGSFNDSSTYTISNFIFNGRPNSRGYLQLNTTNPAGPVDFGFGFYTDPDQSDIKVIVEGIRLAIQMFEDTTAYKRLGASVSRDNIRGCESFQWGTDAYWECYIKQKTSGFYHPVGSCPMGSGEDDPTAVVDSKLRVIGVEGLRVIDSSIMPQITNSNIQAPTLVIAKKGADEVLAYWRNRK